MPLVRPLTEADLPAAAAIQNAVYLPLYREDAEVLGSRIIAAPTLCWGAFEGDDLAAYILSHPWPAAAPPPIGVRLSPAPASDNWFVHDLAVSPGARGQGLGLALARRAARAAVEASLTRGDLIAVQGAASFWRRLGYAPPLELPAELAEKVAAYGPDAAYMTIRLSDLVA
jgi:GNAT superfamily N-acetyltransferase